MQQATPRAETPDTEKTESQQASGTGRLRLSLAEWSFLALAALVILSLLLPLTNAGLWDPFELEAADLARRVAVNVFAADNLARETVDNAIPTVEEVGRGELPVLSAGLALRLLGASASVLRGTALFWGLLALGAVYLVTSRLGTRRLALLSALVLATCPAFFVQARSVFGDVATMASLATAYAGLMLAVFDERLGQGARWLSFAIGALGMLAGFFCRGAVIGVALPSLAVGGSWLLTRQGGQVTKGRLSIGLAWLALAVGFGFAVWGGWAAVLASKDEYLKALGSQVAPAKQFPTHDFVVHSLGHGMFPWSALVPAAVALCLRPLPEENTRQSALRLSLLLLAVLGVAAYGFLAPVTGLLAPAPVFALTGLVALALTDIDVDRRGVALAAMLSAALLVLLATDFEHFPEKAFSAFAIDAKFPKSFERAAKWYVRASMGLGLSACVLLIVERSLRLSSWSSSKLVRWFRLPRPGTLLAAAVTCGGLTLSLGYYPALAARLSPVGALDTYRQLAPAGEPLAMMGSRAGSSFFAGQSSEVFKGTKQAIDWLTEKPGQRRWLIAKSDDLAALNSRFRKATEPPKNLAVLDAHSNRSLLLSNVLREGEHDENPLQKWLPETPPKVANPLAVELDGKLRVLGWEIRRKSDGKPVQQIVIGEALEFVIVYEVLGRVVGKWETFIHIDGEGSRYNGDHPLLDGDYELRLWNAGDYVVDIFEFEVDDDYKPGRYQVYFGLFSGDKRLPVSAGEHDDNRVAAGSVQVVDR